MDSITKAIAVRCINAEIVSPENEEWLVYSLEKRLTTAATLIPFFIIAVLFSDFLTAASFLGSFYYMRSKINGFHADRFWKCLFISLTLELLLIGLLLTYLNFTVMCIAGIVNIAIIYLFAPYNHPAMNLRENEIEACRKSARKRIAVLSVLCIASYIAGIEEISKGITLGNIMAAFLLAFAYIIR